MAEDLSEIGDEALAQQARMHSVAMNQRVRELTRRGLKVTYSLQACSVKEGEPFESHYEVDAIIVERTVKL